MRALLFLLPLAQSWASEAIVPARGRAPVDEAAVAASLAGRLPDLDCEWIDGGELLIRYPAVSRRFDKLYKIDWFIAGELKREIAYLRFCLTSGSPAAVYRFMDTAYLDLPKLQAATPKLQSDAVLHAVLQSYLDPKISTRRKKLTALLDVFNRVESGRIVSRKVFHQALAATGAALPRTVSSLDPYRTQVEFILASAEERGRRVHAATEPEKLIALPEEKILPLLSDWDVTRLPPLRDLLVEGIERALVSSSLEDFESILLAKKFTKVNPAQPALRGLDELSAEKRALLFSSDPYLRHLESLYGFLNDARVRVQDRVSSASPALQALGAYPAEEEWTLLLEMIPRELGGEQMPLPGQAIELLQTIALLARQGEWEQVRLRFTEDPRFYSRLGLEAPFATVRGMEKSSVHLERIRDGFLSVFFKKLSAQLGEDAQDALYTMIRFDRFPKR